VPSSTLGPRSRARILVVEDDQETVGALRDILSERWDVSVAADAASAVQRWERDAPDVMVLDLRLEGPSDGVDVFHDIRRRMSARPPTLLLSGFEGAEQVGRALRVPVLRKPFQVDELLAAVEGLLATPRAE